MRLIDVELFRDELYKHYELLNIDDYEVWAVVDVDEVLFNIEEIKAIPIEWLYQKRTLYLENECHMSLMVINELLNWWEKENERQV